MGPTSPRRSVCALGIEGLFLVSQTAVERGLIMFGRKMSLPGFRSSPLTPLGRQSRSTTKAKWTDTRARLLVQALEDRLAPAILMNSLFPDPAGPQTSALFGTAVAASASHR